MTEFQIDRFEVLKEEILVQVKESLEQKITNFKNNIQSLKAKSKEFEILRENLTSHNATLESDFIGKNFNQDEVKNFMNFKEKLEKEELNKTPYQKFLSNVETCFNNIADFNMNANLNELCNKKDALEIYFKNSLLSEAKNKIESILVD